MGVGMVIFLLFPQLLMQIFSAPEVAMAMGVPALRIISLSFLFAGVSIILGAAFQALGVPLFSLILSVLRQAVIVLPVCLALVFIAPAQVWWCLPAAEIISCAVALVLYRWVYHTRILPLGAASRGGIL